MVKTGKQDMVKLDEYGIQELETRYSYRWDYPKV